MRNLTRDRHSALNARDDMLAIADLWPNLQAALRPGGSINQGMPKGSEIPAPINLTVSEVIDRVHGWVMFLTRVLMEEADWTPPSTDDVTLLQVIARERIGHFSEHEDEGLRLSFLDDAAEMRKLVENTVAPTGARWRKIGLECAEYGVSDMGERVPCEGEYRVWWDPAKEFIGDLVCSVDREHRVTATEWQRAWRKSKMDTTGVQRLLTRLRSA